LGGATHLELMNLSDAQIAEMAEREVAQVLRITGAPVTNILRRWARALPQYNLGHGKIVSALEQELRHVPGLFLAGNYLSGPSVGSCAEQAVKRAGEVESYAAAKSDSSSGASNSRKHS
jgi:oxygen-dependent protoporphyrinogen oxidase